jgi:small subunit ribosomal protein S9
MTTADRYFQGTGRRKRAVARVRLTPGAESMIVVDGKPLEERFPLEIHRRSIMQPLVATDSARPFAISVKVTGGGVTGQAEAIRHGIARALINLDVSMRPVLKKAGFLTRDSREKERKKYGLFRARKKQQYSKR